MEAMILKDCERTGDDLPDRIANAPNVHPAMEFYYQAFLELSSERPIGFGEGRIPITSILAYSRHHRLGDDEEADLVYFVNVLDAAYLKERASD